MQTGQGVRKVAREIPHREAGPQRRLGHNTLTPQALLASSFIQPISASSSPADRPQASAVGLKLQPIDLKLQPPYRPYQPQPWCYHTTRVAPTRAVATARPPAPTHQPTSLTPAPRQQHTRHKAHACLAHSSRLTPSALPLTWNRSHTTCGTPNRARPATRYSTP